MHRKYSVVAIVVIRTGPAACHDQTEHSHVGEPRGGRGVVERQKRNDNEKKHHEQPLCCGNVLIVEGVDVVDPSLGFARLAEVDMNYVRLGVKRKHGKTSVQDRNYKRCVLTVLGRPL